MMLSKFFTNLLPFLFTIDKVNYMDSFILHENVEITKEGRKCN